MPKDTDDTRRGVPLPTTPDAEPDVDLREHTESLRGVLEEMTSVYNLDGSSVPLRFGQKSCAADDGSWVQIDPSLPYKVGPDVKGPNVLRFLDDVLAHEVGHYNWSDLKSKQVFMSCYPHTKQLAGQVANILEDEYDDAKRMRRWYGMRTKRAYRVWLQMNTDDWCPPVDKVCRMKGLSTALVVALHQTALAGYVNGIEDAPDEIAEFCAIVSPVIDRVRGQDDPNERFRLFHVVMQVLLRYAPDAEEIDMEEFEKGPGRTISGGVRDPDGDDVPWDDGEPPTVEMDDDLREEIEEAMRDAGLEPVTPDPSDDDADEDEPEDGADGEESDAERDPDDLDDGSDDTTRPKRAPSDTDTPKPEGGEDDGDDGEEGVDEDEEEAEPSVPGLIEFEVDREDVEHHVRDMAEEFKSRDKGEIEDRYSVRLDSIDRIDDRDRARWARLLRKLHEYGLDVEQRKRERDERARTFRSHYGGSPHGRRKTGEGLRKRAVKKGIIAQLEDGFREIVSRRTPEPDEVGDRMDTMNVVRRAAGDLTTTELFEEEIITETGDRCIGFAADISGSMGSSIDGLKIAGGCIAEATSMVGDKFVFSAFTDIPRHHGSPEALDLRVVTGPNEEFEWGHLDSFDSARNEPTAAGIRDCRRLMEQTDAKQYLMIVITDGMALITEDGKMPGNNEPVEQARLAVNECRRAGIEVIGLGIGGMDARKMEETFGGRNYRVTSINTLADDILELYRAQLHTTT